MNAPPAFFNQQQQQQQGPVQGFMGIQVAPVGQRHLGVMHDANPVNIQAGLEEFMQETGIENPSVTFSSGQTARELQGLFGPRSVQNERQRMRRRRQVDIMSVPVMNLADPARPAQPQQRQAGRGVLPGARNAQPNRAGVGLLGNYRVERPGVARGQGQQQQQRIGPGSNRGGRSVHTDHPPSFACTICRDTGHLEADCAKPSKTGDNSYCPYHRSVSGSEEHADSKCHKCVDKCWEAAVNEEGRGLARAEIDRLVTEFIRAHRGGRPEPRCAYIHSHWAMCVARHARANGLQGLDASLLPVRRSEVLRRRNAGQLPWTQFDHRNVNESRRQFRDTHWECDDEAELIERLQDYARTGKYQSASQRRQRRTAQDEAREEHHGNDIAMDEEDASADESGGEDDDHDSGSSTDGDVGPGLGGEEEYPPDDPMLDSNAGDDRYRPMREEEEYAPGGDDKADFGHDSD